MTRHTLPWTFEEIGRAANKSLEVEFACDASPGSAGSYWEPPEPPEIDFADVVIVKLLNADGEIAVGPSWQRFLKGIAFDLAERDRSRLEESLSERVGDYEEAAREEYYDRQRDELRGY
jgi:hypothetical protein